MQAMQIERNEGFMEGSDVAVEAHGVVVPMPGGSETYFNFHWLRDNCPSSFDPVTRERVFDLFAGRDRPRARSAALRDGGLVIEWEGEDHTSHYPFAMLGTYATGEPRPDPADLPRRAWYADHYDAMVRVSHGRVLDDAAERRRWMEALLIDGVAIVTDMPDCDEGLTRTAEAIGTIRPSFFGTYFDVRTHIAPTNLAFTASALEMHTDVPAEELAPGIQFLHCRANTVRGGRNLFLDGLAVANDLCEADPEAFRLLSETEIPFYKEHDHIDMRARQRVIELDRHGAVTGVTMSQHMADMIDLPQRQLDRYYPALVRFGRMMHDERYVMRFSLRAGECIVFDNHRIVHGREAYSATSGDRYLRGTYTDRGELRGRYRAMVSDGRFK